MNTPRIKIYFESGALGQVIPDADGVFGILCTAAPVAGTFALNTPYVLRSMDSLTPLGVTATNNPALYRVISEFYAEAGAGMEVWIMGFADTVKMSDMVDVNVAANGKALINAANGRLRALFITRTPAGGYVPTIANGLDSDVATAHTKAQALALWATNSLYAPLFVILDGYAYTGNPIDLTDLTTGTDNRVGIMIGSSAAASKNAAVGLAGGRLARLPIPQKIAAPAYGSLNTLGAFLNGVAVERADWDSVHAKGYITFRTHVNRSGYFFVDDPLATLPTDDYNSITARRTIDKAFRIAYDTMLNKLLTPVPVTASGQIQPAMAKAWEADVENAIATGMTVRGELSADVADPRDKGVQCYINPAQPLLSTSQMNIRLRIRPFGYPRFIDIYLGFQVVSA